MQKYNKFLVAVGAALAVAASALQDGSVSGAELSSILVAAVGAVLVWLVPNKQ